MAFVTLSLIFAGVLALCYKTVEHIAVDETSHFTRATLRRLRNILQDEKYLPENHDVVGAFKVACRESLEYLLDRYSSRPSFESSKAQILELVEIVKVQEFDIDLGLIEKKLTSLLSGDDTKALGDEDDVAATFEDSVLEWLEQKSRKSLPAWFRPTFRDGSKVDGMVLQSWRIVFRLYMAEQIKTNDRLYQILTYDELLRSSFGKAQVTAFLEVVRNKERLKEALDKAAVKHNGELTIDVKNEELNAAQMHTEDVPFFNSDTFYKLKFAFDADHHVFVIQLSGNVWTFTPLAYDSGAKRLTYETVVKKGLQLIPSSGKGYKEPQSGRHSYFAVVSTEPFPTTISENLKLVPKSQDFAIAVPELTTFLELLQSDIKTIRVLLTECVVV